MLDLKQGIDELRRNRTFKYILYTLLNIGNFLNGSEVNSIIVITTYFSTIDSNQLSNKSSYLLRTGLLI